MEEPQHSNFSQEEQQGISPTFPSSGSFFQTILEDSEPWLRMTFIKVELSKENSTKKEIKKFTNRFFAVRAATNENNNIGLEQLDQFYYGFITNLESALAYFKNESILEFRFIELRDAVEGLKGLSKLELYQRVVTSLNAQDEREASFWEPNPSITGVTQESVTKELETLQKKVRECQDLLQKLKTSVNTKDRGQIRAVPYLKIKVLYLMSFLAHQLKRQSFNSPILSRLLKCGERGPGGHSWSELPLETVKLWFFTVFEMFDQTTALWKDFETIKDSLPNPYPYPKPYIDLHAHAWSRAEILVNELTSSRSRIMCHSLTYEIQPQEIFKGNEAVPISLLLFLPKSMFQPDLGPRNFIVEFKIVNRASAQQLLSNLNQENIQRMDGFNTLNNENLDVVPNPDCIQLSFKQLIPIGLRRPNPILQQYLSLLVRVHFQCNGEEIMTWCLSAPFIYITGNIQRLEAQGSMAWYNLFKKSTDINGNWTPLEVDERVDKSQMRAAFSRYFNKTLGTDRELTPASCDYLLAKLLRARNYESRGRAVDLDEDDTISLAMFLKTIKEEGHSFWDWFYQTVQLAKNHLRLFWKNDVLLEFMNRVHAEDVTVRQFESPGVFFPRFNDCLPAGVSICYVDSAGESQSLQPYTDQDLGYSSLLHRLQGCFDFRCMLLNSVQEIEGQKISWIWPKGDFNIPDLTPPSRPEYMRDPQTGRNWVIPYPGITTFSNPPPEIERPVEVQAPIQAPVQEPAQIPTPAQGPAQWPAQIPTPAQGPASNQIPGQEAAHVLVQAPAPVQAEIEMDMDQDAAVDAFIRSIRTRSCGYYDSESVEVSAQ